MIKVIVNGSSGRLGQSVILAAQKHSDAYKIVAGIDKFPTNESFPVFERPALCNVDADVIIDFSRPDALSDLLGLAVKKKTAVVIATTGLSHEHVTMINEAANEIPVFFSANMSLGVNLQIDLIKRAAAFLGDSFDVEIIEMHHNTKVDSPSGTAIVLADAIREKLDGKELVYGRHTKTQKRLKSEIGIHSVRGGTIVGEHQVHFIGDDEVVEIKHTALSKQVFALGSLRAAEYVVDKAPKVYSMKDFVAEFNSVTNLYKEENQAIVTLSGVPYSSCNIFSIFERVADINLDMISQTAPVNGFMNISFTLPQAFLSNALSALDTLKSEGIVIASIVNIGKLSIEGVGMEHHHGIAAKVFGTLAADNIEIKLVTTSETKISCCIDSAKLDIASDLLCASFKL